mmetsp:Transcript_103073/g.204639  ORF Transcript_103073/g.204639 Transcript_103073/m.204639 type:complete len:425 (-) Transcript_103073:29-1303(-)
MQSGCRTAHCRFVAFCSTWLALLLLRLPLRKGRDSIHKLALATTSVVPRPWLVASWNQHRKSSYLQKDCPWIRKLENLGNSKGSIIAAIENSRVEYSPLEIQEWADGYDITAVQEMDPLFRAALGERLGAQLVHGANDWDGRGIEVESTSALLLHPDSGIKPLHVEQALLQFKTRPRVTVKRDHTVVLVERLSDGRRAVFCSLHLHPPQMIDRAGVKYLHYLKPLRTAIEKIAASDLAARSKSESSLGGLGNMDCFLVGDFNLFPEEFRSRTQSSGFWKQFNVCVPDGGNTASSTNPCVVGDFAVVAGSGWHGRSLGPSGFRAFEQYAEGIAAAANGRIKLEAALDGFEQVVADCKSAVFRAEAVQRSCQSHGRSTSPHLRMALQQLRRGGRRLKEDLARTVSTNHRKRLFTSDHRPLHYVCDV